MTELFPVFFVLLYFCFSFADSVKEKRESTLLIRIGQIVFQVQDRLTVALKAEADKALDTCHPGIGDLAEALTLSYI